MTGNAVQSSLSSYDDLTAALRGARSIVFSAYTLRTGPTEAALIDRARAGASVAVRLSAQAYAGGEGVVQQNIAEAARLRAAGVDARVATGEPAGSGSLGDAGEMHLKAAVVDGVAFLDDRNWNGPQDLIVRDGDGSDVARIAAEIRGEDDAASDAPSANGVALHKWIALRQEAAVVAGGGEADVATESIGPSTLCTALRSDAAAGTVVRLIVSKRAIAHDASAQREIAQLRAAGVEIRCSDANDKLAVSADGAWAGSANASGGDPWMSDWGIAFRDAASIAALRSRFTAEWNAAKPLRDAV